MATACAGDETGQAAPVDEVRVVLEVFPSQSDSLFLGARTVSGTGGGGFVVADAFADRMIFFDAAGRPTGSVGRSGDGPGEYQRVSAVHRTGGGLVLWDFLKMRVTVLAPSGATERTVSLPFLAGIVQPYRDEGMVALTFDRDAGLRPGIAWTENLLAQPSPSWRTFELPPTDDTPAGLADGGVPVVGAGPSGRIYLGWGDVAHYRILVLDSLGRVARTVERPGLRPQRSAESLRRVEERRERTQALTGVRSEAAEVAPSEPHYRAFREDSCGRLWVETSRGGDAATVVDLFSSAQEYLGEVTFSMGGSLHDVFGARAYLVVDDASGVPGVVVYDLGPMACGNDVD